MFRRFNVSSKALRIIAITLLLLAIVSTYSARVASSIVLFMVSRAVVIAALLTWIAWFKRHNTTSNNVPSKVSRNNTSV